MITGSQCQAARALVEITISKLAKRSGVDQNQIEAFEQKRGSPDALSVDKLQEVLEDLGAVFISEDDNGGVGARLKHNKSETRQITRMEDEGGIIASDKVP